MNAILKDKFTAQTPSAYSVKLRQRIERLEYLREDACMRREREAVELIDKQIKHTVWEWKQSFGSKKEMLIRKVG